VFVYCGCEDIKSQSDGRQSLGGAKHALLFVVGKLWDVRPDGHDSAQFHLNRAASEFLAARHVPTPPILRAILKGHV
jgi:hypothetical protein